mmetsp:Transcript_35248/g.101231  ORF Transcript_35248/g.101231 Transcript_35248/m.101231 type:complete len:303 (+) Transcript_35248:544-1452(+)
MTRDSPYPYLPCSELVLVLASVMFVVGSFCFLPGPWEDIRIGDILFIFGSFIYLGKSAISMRELCSDHGHHVVKAVEHGADFFENVCYFVACIVFTAGCVLWWPGIYANKESKLVGQIIASWCFIIGSLGFVVASFCNAVLLSKSKMFALIPGKSGELVYFLAFTSLLCSQLGGVFFTTGSYMYRPGFNNHCERHIRAGWSRLTDASDKFDNVEDVIAWLHQEFNLTRKDAEQLIPADDWCVDIEAYGTLLYIVGSCLYLIQSVLYYIIAVIKEREERRRGFKVEPLEEEGGTSESTEEESQ